MNDFDLVRKNLFRRKLRAILMIVSILIAFMIFGVLAGFHRAFTAGEDAAAADRMITVNKINFTQPMPIAYFNRVRAVEGVRQVTFANWFGGYYQDPKNFIMALAIEPNTYFDVYRSDSNAAGWRYNCRCSDCVWRGWSDCPPLAADGTIPSWTAI